MKKIVRIILKFEAIDAALAMSLVSMILVFIIHQQTMHLAFLFLSVGAVIVWVKYGYRMISNWLEKD